VIVGAGFGGLAAAIELREHGFEDVVILEAGEGLGGTWRHNSYPGAACDVPSHLYSLSFAQRRDWERLYPTQPTILAYIEETARRYGIDRIVEPDSKVVGCGWDDRACHWELTLANGRGMTADAVIVATGQLHQPFVPGIDGLDDFAGRVFHSAEWDHDCPFEGSRVAVIGTGASAVQFVPEVAGRAATTFVFQRTANWFLPRRNRSYPRPYAFAIRHVPGLQALRRRAIYWYGEVMTAAIRHPRTLGRVGKWISTAFIRSQVKDPDLRRKLIPDYTFGCKRVLFSSFFLPTLQRPDVELVTESIERIAESGIVTSDGKLREVDCIVLGTGFRTGDFMFPMEVTGVGGASLRDAWADGPHAHLGITVPGFPSLFLMYGPNTNTSGGSIITYLEAQAAYIRQALDAVRVRGSAAVDVRPEVEAGSDAATQRRFAATAWLRCDSWYRDSDGRMVANWPGYMHEYEAATRRFDPTEYTFVEAAAAASPH